MAMVPYHGPSTLRRRTSPLWWRWWWRRRRRGGQDTVMVPVAARHMKRRPGLVCVRPRRKDRGLPGTNLLREVRDISAPGATLIPLTAAALPAGLSAWSGAPAQAPTPVVTCAWMPTAKLCPGRQLVRVGVFQLLLSSLSLSLSPFFGLFATAQVITPGLLRP
ncbi:hypothetical protein GGR56DRAFT_661812 [Xylariaceae sp. FL0804]|nr:hypothetical protein GGR56DRAFT_661812 [Xylariaceae sp. FL0804]